MTPLQERRLRQTEESVAYYERRVARSSWLRVLLLTFGWVLLMTISDVVIEVMVENISWSQGWRTIEWKKLPVRLVFWFVIILVFDYYGTRSTLKAKRKELAELQERYRADQ